MDLNPLRPVSLDDGRPKAGNEVHVLPAAVRAFPARLLLGVVPPPIGQPEGDGAATHEAVSRVVGKRGRFARHRRPNLSANLCRGPGPLAARVTPIAEALRTPAVRTTGTVKYG